ncbi:putative ToxD-like zinc binding oxidoreductase [Zopfia rhizophila CBS 207.26]|uniref:Putative ToxD-like zinc binding oxidoreductase n=1 Tax=Zopfia rhizophila CBS 207.26 TaxID=1314779 RepID=A0A6A6E885_9PEZI|nr:putative ToxD-like zinc binding oxidoreductase [Zopfia rhizophila CBS 207.26]
MKALVSNRGFLSRSANLLTGKSIGNGVKVKEVPKPTISDNEILIRVHATALNPIDFKFIDFIAPPGSITGCDFAGVVVEVGEVASGTWKAGNRVAGFVQGGVSEEYGSFAEYVKAEGDLVWRIPEGVSDEEASTYGVSAATAMQALNLHLDVPWVDEVDKEGKMDKGSPIFIYAGSSTVGLFAIQLAKKAGCTIVTTASPHSFDLVKSYGADNVFDYRASNAVQEITKTFPDITRAIDCFSEGDSIHFCAQVLKSKGGKVITLLDTQLKTPGVEVQMIMSFQLLGRAFAWSPPIGPNYPASTSDREALAHFYASLFSLAQELKAPPVTLLEGGFEGILEGLDRLRTGKVSGSKLVVQY